jgi:hypothetical protein
MRSASTAQKPRPKETHYAVAKRLGLIACIDGPADLSKNRRKYIRQALRGKHRPSMNEKIKYTDEPLGDLKVVPDFLPRPQDIVFRGEGVKVTISLSRRSVDFFKGEARKHNTQYQRIIRRLLDAYAEHHAKQGPAARSARARHRASRG